VKPLSIACLTVTFVLVGSVVWSEEPEADTSRFFQLKDVFELEFASDPQISPDGAQIVYIRNFMDIMTDRRRSDLWIVDSSGTRHRPLTSAGHGYSSPRWSPDGTRIAYASSENDATQLFVRWMDTGQTAQVTRLTESPGSLAWSPDGRWLAFTMKVKEKDEPLAKLPEKPDDAEWAKPAKVIDKLLYRADGEGYIEDGYSQLFVVPAEGGSPRQLTSGPYHHNSRPSWTPDSANLVFSANRHDDWEYDPVNSEVYRVSIDDGVITALTDRHGPDNGPVVSPDGARIAYLGYDEQWLGHQNNQIYLMNMDGSNNRQLTREFDYSAGNLVWRADGQGLYFLFDEKGDSKVGLITLDGAVSILAENLGGTSLGRPYSGGAFSVSRNGRVAFTQTGPHYPADVAVALSLDAPVVRLTYLNDDLFGHKTLGDVEEIWYESSFDGRRIHGWVVTPPEFDRGQQYPLILEIHGGPYANYGPRFSAEIQLYAQAGYVVLYTNPRGSTSYGADFANLIQYNYPGQDYDDLMSGVDAVIERGYIDEDRLYVTGGSGGGVLSSWIIGKTDRFRAAVVAKPVINWYSLTLTTDIYNYMWKYWFRDYPWEDPDSYLERSPLSLVGNVTTPTMLIGGELDYRTPISESEQYYQALKLRKVEAVLVRIPGSSHNIAARPSNLIAKVAHVLKWFDSHGGEEQNEVDPGSE